VRAENSAVSIKNKSFSVTAELDIPDSGVNGVMAALGTLAAMITWRSSQLRGGTW
jgi:hypothetical protein